MWSDQTWTTHLIDALKKLSMHTKTPIDIAEFCPQYSTLNSDKKLHFWAYLMSAMAQQESNFRPALTFEEGFNDSTGNPVISRGLFQISIESANGYGCNFNTTEELHDPLRNISCSAKILDRWVVRDNYVGKKVGEQNLGGARYWAVFRKDKTRNTIKNNTLNFCKTL